MKKERRKHKAMRQDTIKGCFKMKIACSKMFIGLWFLLSSVSYTTSQAIQFNRTDYQISRIAIVNGTTAWIANNNNGTTDISKEAICVAGDTWRIIANLDLQDTANEAMYQRNIEVLIGDSKLVVCTISMDDCLSTAAHVRTQTEHCMCAKEDENNDDFSAHKYWFVVQQIAKLTHTKLKVNMKLMSTDKAKDAIIGEIATLPMIIERLDTTWDFDDIALPSQSNTCGLEAGVEKWVVTLSVTLQNWVTASMTSPLSIRVVEEPPPPKNSVLSDARYQTKNLTSDAEPKTGILTEKVCDIYLFDTEIASPREQYYEAMMMVDNNMTKVEKLNLTMLKVKKCQTMLLREARFGDRCSCEQTSQSDPPTYKLNVSTLASAAHYGNKISVSAEFNVNRTGFLQTSEKSITLPSVYKEVVETCKINSTIKNANAMETLTDVDSCQNYTCNGNGKCVDLKPNYRCDCDDGFMGTNCEYAELIKVLHHINSVKKNMFYYGEKTTVECCAVNLMSPFQVTMTVNSQEIAAAPNTACVSTPVTFQFTSALPVYTVKVMYKENDGKCKRSGKATYTVEDINLCQPSTCNSHGKCVDQQPKYRCYCDKKFWGTHCEYDLRDCSDRPCKYGRCRDEEKEGYTCICPKGMTGAVCDEKQILEPLAPVNITYTLEKRGKGNGAQPVGRGTIAGIMIAMLVAGAVAA